MESDADLLQYLQRNKILAKPTIYIYFRFKQIVKCINVFMYDRRIGNEFCVLSHFFL